MTPDRDGNEDARTSGPGVRLEAARLLSTEGKIAAIRYVREKTGLELVRAKAYVEALASGRNPDEAAQSVQPAQGGCLTVSLLVLVAAALFVWWFTS
jgi:hypothetical protein